MHNATTGRPCPGLCYISRWGGYRKSKKKQNKKRGRDACNVSSLAAPAAATPLGSLKIMWRGAMITQTPEYVITAANNRRIVYVNTFICLSLASLRWCVHAGFVIFLLSVADSSPCVVFCCCCCCIYLTRWCCMQLMLKPCCGRGGPPRPFLWPHRDVMTCMRQCSIDV